MNRRQLYLTKFIQTIIKHRTLSHTPTSLQMRKRFPVTVHRFLGICPWILWLSTGSSDPENPSPEIIGLRRPPGPLSKPNSGGYLLKATLNWDNALYKSVQVRTVLIVKDLTWFHPWITFRMAFASYAYNTLTSGLHGKNNWQNQLPYTWKTLSDLSVSSSYHSPPSKAIAKFPILRKYQGAWPAEDFASIYLKNSSCDYRQNTKRTTESYIGRWCVSSSLIHLYLFAYFCEHTDFPPAPPASVMTFKYLYIRWIRFTINPARRIHFSSPLIYVKLMSAERIPCEDV